MTDFYDFPAEEANRIWQWDFDDDGITDSTNRNPTYSYSDYGKFTVVLKVWDGTGYGPCREEKDISVRFPLPKWKETPP